MINIIRQTMREIAELGDHDHDCGYPDGCPICNKIAEKKAKLPRWIRIYRYTTTPRGGYGTRQGS